MIAIARATTEDLDALMPLVAAYRVFYEQETDAPRERELIAGHLRNGTSTIFFARGATGDPSTEKYTTWFLAPYWILCCVVVPGRTTSVRRASTPMA